NLFQKEVELSQKEINNKVLEEFTKFETTLSTKGINVFIAEDSSEPVKPDAIFPNNWISFHKDGTAVLYPMAAENRRPERRWDIVRALKAQFKITQVLDFSYFEDDDVFLEGTGSIIFDHVNKLAYACLSPRTHKKALLKVCQVIGYKAIPFTALDAQGAEIYHTNVMMCIAPEFAVICLESITSEKEKKKIIKSFESTGHQIIDISLEQVNAFAGNMLALRTSKKEQILVMSGSAYKSLTPGQIELMEKSCVLLPLEVDTIEQIGGGSARCMIAELFCTPKA
ncbi:MAG: hypothetical protein ACI959_001555, partial [Limisphaerales bacterium]